MVEAMYEQTPDFFRSFQKNFRYFICEFKPNLSSTKLEHFAIAKHEPNRYCPLSDNPHYHVLADLESSSSDIAKSLGVKPYVVPCLLTTFRLLIFPSNDIVLFGSVMEKLQAAATYNSVHELDLGNVSLRKRLPHICFSQKKTAASQTDLLPSATIERFIKLMHGPNASEFCRIMDILLSGYGSFDVDNIDVFVKFHFERKYTV